MIMQALMMANLGVNLLSATYDDLSFGGTAECQFQIRQDGQIGILRFGSGNFILGSEWFAENLNGLNVVPGYQARFTYISGTINVGPTAPFGTWFATTSNGGLNSFGTFTSPPASQSGVVQVDFRNALTLAIVATAIITVKNQ